MFIDNYYFSVNIKDCLFLEVDMPAFIVATPSTLISKLEIDLQSVKCKNLKGKKKWGIATAPPPPPLVWYERHDLFIVLDLSVNV